jgi:hypothetical protein
MAGLVRHAGHSGRATHLFIFHVNLYHYGGTTPPAQVEPSFALFYVLTPSWQTSYAGLAGWLTFSLCKWAAGSGITEVCLSFSFFFFFFFFCSRLC